MADNGYPVSEILVSTPDFRVEFWRILAYANVVLKDKQTRLFEIHYEYKRSAENPDYEYIYRKTFRELEKHSKMLFPKNEEAK